jgi:hypothetical protein
MNLEIRFHLLKNVHYNNKSILFIKYKNLELIFDKEDDFLKIMWKYYNLYIDKKL